jgi:uncharacterized protein YndB with AHSA1/START domain
MHKTGESYTAARAQILKQNTSAPSTAAPTAKDYPALAGMSDSALKKKTGCTWARWVKALDYYGAAKMTHRDIVSLVAEKYEVDSWWAQTVTVGYERIKGLRARGQRRDGRYDATKSRTFKVPLETLFAAWADARIRRRWLTGAETKVRKTAAAKSIRLDWTDGNDRGIVAVGFTAKGATKSAVALSQNGFGDRESAARRKQYWTARLDALEDVLAGR